MRVSDTSKYLVGMQSDLDPRKAKYFLETEANNLMQPIIGNAVINGNGEQVMTIVKVSITDKNVNLVFDKKGKVKTTTEKRPLYYEAGDFRSDMCIEMLKQCDIVCANSPFSLFREYVAQLMEYGKKFLIIGNLNAITYKEFFPLLKDNLVWLGPSISSGDRPFNVPENYPLNAVGCGVDKNSRKFIRVKGVRWFTNLDHAKRHQLLSLDLGCMYYGYEDIYECFDGQQRIITMALFYQNAFGLADGTQFDGLTDNTKFLNYDKFIVYICEADTVDEKLAWFERINSGRAFDKSRDAVSYCLWLRDDGCEEIFR